MATRQSSGDRQCFFYLFSSLAKDIRNANTREHRRTGEGIRGNMSLHSKNTHVLVCHADI